MNYKLSFVLLIAFFNTSMSFTQEKNLEVLVFSKTQAFRHKSIPTGLEFLADMAKKNNWNIKFSEDSNDFSISNLSQYQVLVFLNTSGDIFSEAQKAALQNYFSRGKGFVGIHAASDTEKDWGWFTEMIGATFKNHPKVQEATLNINTECNHPAINGLKSKEVFKDEWYNFLKPVGKHVSVLASLDESSYEGKKMDTDNHPISWYHIYDGGRVFYTGLGHTDEIYNDSRYYSHIEGGILWASGMKKEPSISKKWTNLIDGNPHKNWDVFIGAPHATVKDLEGVDPKSDGKNAKPLGLNNDPKKVFDFKTTIEGEQVLHISGEIYGALTSKKEYENYHLKLQFKWGKNIWEPRLLRKRDSGILYHCTGPNGAFWNVWMQSQEFQVQEGDMGDYYALAGTIIDIPSVKKEGQKEFDYAVEGQLHTFSSTEKKFPAHCNKGLNNENPHGEWNTLELICFEGTSLHIVNGKVVNALFNSRHKDLDDNIVPLQKGRIQIQSEAAEAFYKTIKIKSIDKIPNKYKKYVKGYMKG
ncbi:ThuA domain-containing protein [Algibacter luteus]|uniref:ThuA domain-containing protein n=1 Tax=Algibacter luteus TaxID=1178825 RepID=UPI00259ACC7A|nr:ThuA domain-containing protein [Algibacter luteus]WJJ97739.1 ThuA domain-containing protein [Algibacter luteus]